MWIVDQVEFRARELDFRSAELGRHTTMSVLADGREIVNALDLLDWDVDAEGEPIQLMVCEACGFPGCSSGNRVVFKRFADGLVVLPAFEAMGGGDWELTEYRPPYFMEERGCPFLRGRALEALVARIPELADLERWPWMTVREAALLMQWEAPSLVLGEYPAPPQLREERIAAVSHGIGGEPQAALKKFLQESLFDDRRASPVPGEPVFFYLDQAGYPEWAALAWDGTEYRLAAALGIGVSARELSVE